MAEKRGLLTGYRVNRVQEFAVEALMVLDTNRNADRMEEQARARAEDFWHEFLSKIAARAPEPWVALAAFMPELNIDFSDADKEKGEYPAEDTLPPPSDEERIDIERWAAEHQHGSITGSELNGNGKP